MILLSGEEILAIESPTVNMPAPISRAVDIRATRIARETAVAKAQLKKVVGWLFSECENEEHEHGNSGCEFLRYECIDCRQALKKEIE